MRNDNKKQAQPITKVNNSIKGISQLKPKSKTTTPTTGKKNG